MRLRPLARRSISSKLAVSFEALMSLKMSKFGARMTRTGPWLAVGLALGGCTVGPHFQTPAPPQASGYTATPLPARTAASPGPDGGAQRFVEGADIQGQWWTLFQSPALDALVAQALKANPDAEAALAALRASQELAAADRGALLPSADLGYSLSRQKTSALLASPLASNVETFTLHTAQVTVGYVPDVFGGLHRQAETSAAQAEAQRFQAEATYLTLTANLVAAAIQQASLADQVAATRALIADNQRALDVVRRQFQLGETSRADVAAQETLVAQAQQTLPPLEKALAQQGDLIADLTGRIPSQAPAEPIALGSLALPAELPVSLPSRLAQQRPDVRAAEANLHAASAQVGVAMAARLPTFPITAALGGQSPTLTTLLANGNTFWAVTGAVAQPVFRGGALLHRQRAAEATLDQAKAQYRSTVLTAFQNVADALRAIEIDARALQAAAATQKSAADSLAVARQQFTAGQASVLPMLTAQQAEQQAQLAVIQARAARLADTAALFQSLGGGWWNRTDIPGPQASATSLGRE